MPDDQLRRTVRGFSRRAPSLIYLDKAEDEYRCENVRSVVWGEREADERSSCTECECNGGTERGKDTDGERHHQTEIVRLAEI